MRTLSARRTILVVDDSADILELLELALSKSGHAVLSSSCAGEALDLWQAHAASIDLLITDVKLGESESGLDLAERLLNLKHTLKVLAMTGLMGVEFFGGHGHKMQWLRKPFSLAEFQARVSALLEMVEPCAPLPLGSPQPASLSAAGVNRSAPRSWLTAHATS